MSALLVLALASVAETPALMLVAPAIAAVFLLSPAIGIFKHDETPAARAGVRLEAYEVMDDLDAHHIASRFRMVLVNDDDVAAEDIRIRLLIPNDVVPADTRMPPLGSLLVGTFGSHWFLDSMLDATVITFRTAPRGAVDAVACPAHSRQDLTDLVLPAQGRPFDLELDYQVSGGNVKATLGRLRLRSET